MQFLFFSCLFVSRKIQKHFFISWGKLSFVSAVMPQPLEVDAELTGALSAALFEYRPASGGDAFVVFYLPGNGRNATLIGELTAYQARALLTVRAWAAPKAKAKAKAKAAAAAAARERSRSPRRYALEL